MVSVVNFSFHFLFCLFVFYLLFSCWTWLEFCFVCLFVFLYQSVQFNHSVMSNSLWHQELQHARLPCPSRTPRAGSNSLSIKLMMPSSHLTLCHSLILLPFFPSIRVFSKESVLPIRCPKYWSFSISPSNGYSGLIFLFHSPLRLSSRGCLAPLCFLPLNLYHLHIWGCWYFSQQSWFQLVTHPTWHFSWFTLHRI